MLTDIITASISAIEKKKSAQAKKQSDESLTYAFASLNAVSTRLKATLDCLDAICQNGISTNPLLRSELRDNLLTSISSCGDGAHSGTLTRETVKYMEAQSDQVKRDIDNGWATLSKAYSDGPCGYLSIIGNLTDNPEKAQTLNTDILNAIVTAPSRKSVQTFVTNVGDAQILSASFSMRPEIEIFLKKVKNKEATIVDLTPDIMTWLEEKQLTKKLGIRFSIQ